ncbi:MAG: chemotaxis protein CheA [Oceanococcus sp.]|nr:MAG: chemotaxis protein CheA [Oceanococcus sp.]
MSIDMKQFHQAFFEESFEGLQAMEAALLTLDPDTADSETVNTIFRAAHSIKGGAGTFGFSEIATFTHDLETLLDQVRAGQRVPDGALTDLVLRSVDVLRDMLEGARDGRDDEVANAASVRAEIQTMLNQDAALAQRPVSTVDEATQVGWTIHFKPHRDIMLTGNDPLRILRELARLGEATIEVDAEALPNYPDVDPEQCYLRWTVSLQGEVSENDIREVFAWVEDECDLSIEACADSAPAQAELEPDVATDDTAPATTPKAAATARPAPASKDGGSIRVATEKIDQLINLVGELVITQSMLEQTARALDPVTNELLLSGLSELERNTRHLQEAVMSTRMLPVDFVFSRFPRVVRDTATRLGKQVALQTSGEGAELDKGVIEKIVDPLNHIVRNAIDHGIEMPAEREAAGKPAQASIRLSAWHQGGHIAIQVSDDGKGLNRDKILSKARDAGMNLPDNLPDSEVWQLIFAPGLSTAAEVTDISGRGVGMDVVRRNIQSLGGTVDIESQADVGTRVTIRLPLTLAILDGMSVRVGEEIYILPLNSVVESLQPQLGDVKSMAGSARLMQVRGEFLPLLSLRELFGVAGQDLPLDQGIVVIAEAEGRQVALIVDELVGQQQVVIKSLERNYRRVSGISGATILGDGRVALILDVGEVIRSRQLAAAA